MEQERIVFQTKRSFGIIIFGFLLSIIFIWPIVFDTIKDSDLRGSIFGIVILFCLFWLSTTQEKQITLYETYLRIDSKANVLFKPKEFKYADIKLVVVSYKSWRPTFVGGISIRYMLNAKEIVRGFTVDVKNKKEEYPQLLKHLKELGVYAYEVEDV